MERTHKLLGPISLPVQEGSSNVLVLAKKFKLTQPQLTLLNKGLTFIPTKGSNKNLLEQCRWDLQEYHRRIILISHFQKHKKSDPPPFTPRSNWTPSLDGLPQEVAALIKADLQHFDDYFRPCRMRPNLPDNEVRALQELKQNIEIIIKPADKGSAVVVMDRDQYLWEGKRQLDDTNYYKKLDKPLFPETAKLVKKIIDKLLEKKFINQKQHKYLIGNPEPRARLFYLLPKIHKDPEKWSRPHIIPPGRPIVSDCDSETYFTAEYLEYFLNPLSTKHPSYIQDTYHFIEKIKNIKIPSEAMLFTMDIDSLYTNIDINEGIQAVKNIFLKYPDKRRPEKELLQLLEINLRRNDFEFDGDFYLQIKGTAMGKRFAPSYANIFMAEWEASALAACQKKPLYYFRYLDDVWGVWHHSREDFDAFLAILNHFNPSIHLKSSSSFSSVDFLDTTTFKGDLFKTQNTLDIKVYFKDTDTHALLHKTSFHPKHTYAGLLKSQLIRFHRICTHKQDFMSATKTLFTALAKRGYSRSFRRAALKNFLKTKPILVSDIIPFVTTFSLPSTKFIKTLRYNFHHFLGHHPTFQDHRIIAALRKNKNLQDYLVQAKVKPLLTRKPRGQGQFYRHQVWLRSKTNNKVFKGEPRGDPKAKNCVYLISCMTCGVQYVGETRNTLLQRFTQHRHNILRQKETHIPLVRHFLEHGWPSLQATVIQRNPTWTTRQRTQAERSWIKKLDTIYPRGLNRR